MKSGIQAQLRTENPFLVDDKASNPPVFVSRTSPDEGLTVWQEICGLFARLVDRFDKCPKFIKV